MMINLKKMFREPWTRILAMFVFLTAGVVLYAGPTSLFMIPLCAVVGPAVGLLSTEPYFTPMFKAVLLARLVGSAVLILVGLRKRSRFWGQLLVVIGTGLWVVCGGLGFGPQ